MRMGARAPAVVGARLAAWACILGVILALAQAFADRRPVLPQGVAHPAPESLLLLDVQDVGGNLLAVGEAGYVLRAAAYGPPGSAMATATTATLTALAVSPSGDEILAVGHDSVIMASTTGGRTWQVEFADPEAHAPLLAVYQDAVSGKAFAVGAYGRLLVRAARGQPWVLQDLQGRDGHLNGLVRTGDALLLVGEAGTLLRSWDAGGAWEDLESPYVGSFFGILALENGGVLLYGMRGRAFRSTDAGETWETVSTGTEAALLAGYAAQGRVVLVGQHGRVLVSDHEARQFERLAQTRLQQTLTGVWAGTPDTADWILVGEGGWQRGLEPVGP